MHFRDAIGRAAEELGLAVTRLREKDIWDLVAKVAGVSADVFRVRITSLGKALGPPWRADEKLATAAGCVALASAGRR